MPLPVAIGALCATVALVLYVVGILMTVISGKVKKRNIVMQAIAVALDATATVCMMIQSQGIVPADAHGWIGYSALTLMLIDLVLIVRHRDSERIGVAMRVFALAVLAFWIYAYSLGFVKM